MVAVLVEASQLRTAFCFPQPQPITRFRVNRSNFDFLVHLDVRQAHLTFGRFLRIMSLGRLHIPRDDIYIYICTIIREKSNRK